MKKIEFNKDNDTKKNHFLPKSYLKFFSNNTDYITVYDKDTNQFFKSNISNIGMKNKLYVIENKDIKINWEEFYTKAIDNDIGEMIRNVVATTNKYYIEKPLLINNIKEQLAVAMVIQSLRIPQRIYSQKNTYFDILNCLFDSVAKQNIFDNKFLEELKTKFSSEMYYKDIFFGVANDEDRIDKFAQVLLRKTWIIFVNRTDVDFLIGDNPVLIYDFVNKSTGIQNGFSNAETIIAYPVTPKYMIAIFPNQYLFGKIKENFSDRRMEIYEETVIHTYNKYQFLGSEKQFYGKNENEIKNLLKLL